MHIYCAGPMRGKPDFNFPAFEAATAQLRKLGHEVFNPAERDLTAGFKSLGMTGHEDLSDQGFDLRAALNADLEYITLTADALCVLSGWENSAGARAEVATAHALGLPVVLDGGFLYAWAGKYPYRNNCVVKPELAPFGKLAPVTNIGDKLKLTQTAPGYQSINIDPADVSNTFTGIMQDKLDEKKSRHDHPAGKRRTDSDDAVEYARYPLINPDDWHDPLPISAEQRLGFDPDAELFRGLNEESTAELRRKLAEPEHPEVSAVRKALGAEVRQYQQEALRLGFDPAQETYETWYARNPGALGTQLPLNGEVRSVSSTGGEKGVKLEDHSLIPSGALRKLADHYGVGAKKYARSQWRKGYEWSKSYAAMQRHLVAWWGGEDIDAETGSSHLAAAAWHCFTLLTFIDEHPEFDDRYKS